MYHIDFLRNKRDHQSSFNLGQFLSTALICKELSRLCKRHMLFLSVSGHQTSFCSVMFSWLTDFYSWHFHSSHSKWALQCEGHYGPALLKCFSEDTHLSMACLDRIPNLKCIFVNLAIWIACKQVLKISNAWKSILLWKPAETQSNIFERWIN